MKRGALVATRVSLKAPTGLLELSPGHCGQIPSLTPNNRVSSEELREEHHQYQAPKPLHHQWLPPTPTYQERASENFRKPHPKSSSLLCVSEAKAICPTQGVQFSPSMGCLPYPGGKHSLLPFFVEPRWAPAVEGHRLFAGQPALTR